MRAYISFMFELNLSLFKELPAVNDFSFNKHDVQLGHTYLHPSPMYWFRQSAHFFFFPLKSPFLQLSALFDQKIAESQECGRIESQLADWIVALSQAALSGRSFGRIKKWWMPSPYFWTARSWPQQKAGKAKKETQWFTDQAGENRREGECHSAPTDSHRCKAVLRLLLSSFLLHSFFFLPWYLEEASSLEKFMEGNYHLMVITRFCD